MKRLIIIAACAVSAVGSGACATQQDDDFPPLIEKRKSAEPRQTSRPQSDRKTVPEIKKVEERADASQQLDPREMLEARKLRIQQRWETVQGAVERGEIRTYSKVRRNARFLEDLKMQAQSEAVAEKAQASDAPVLCPWDAISTGETRIVARPDSYAIKSSLPDAASMTVSGTCMVAETAQIRDLSKRVEARRAAIAKQDKANQKSAPPKSAPPRVMLKKLEAPFDYRRTEYGDEVAFSKFGCAYTLTYYCADPTGKNCMDENELIEMADDAILMNGPQ